MKKKKVYIVSPMILEKENTEKDDSDSVIFGEIECAYELLQNKINFKSNIICSLARRELYFDIVGMFDENFTKGFYEDFDFENRQRLKGIFGKSFGSSICYHYRSKTVRVCNDLRKNKAYYEKKYPSECIFPENIEKLKNKHYQAFEYVYPLYSLKNSSIIDVKKIENIKK